MRCAACEHENDSDANFCEACGQSLARCCPSCSRELKTQAKFCPGCGAAVSTAVVSAAQPSVAADPGRDGERRQATVLFCDLAGSTEIASQLDPEDWRDIAAEYQGAAAEAVRRFGGHVDKYLGDGLVCFFGVPQAHEDDAERGVRAGLAIVAAVQHVNSSIAAQHGVSLRVRVGIHTGPVVFGHGGGDARDVFGDTPNVAARVQGFAEPDTVVVTTTTQRLVAGLFAVEPRGAPPLKGVRVPIALYRVLAPSGMRGRLAASAAQGLTPFVGREHERQLLRERWEQAQEGDGQVVLIAGEAGMGKSRLVQQFTTDLGATPHTWLECACSPYHQHTPFSAVIDLMQASFNWPVDLPVEARLDALSQALEGNGFVAAATVPLLAPLLDLPVPVERFPRLTLSPEQQRKTLIDTLVAWGLTLARLQPTVMVVEDLHWADPSTFDFLALLVEQSAMVPMLLLLTARSELRPPWPPRAHHAQLTLNRLSKRHVREMIVQVTTQLLPSSDVIDTLLARTSGVPLFVEELTKAVVEAETTGVASREIPATLQDSLMARLDRLGSAKEVTLIASVIGREFSYALLREVATARHARPVSETELQAALATLVDAELIFTQGVPPDATYRFKHALVQETAYGALLKSQRRELHRAVAEALVKTSPMAAPAAIRAHHWEAAAEIEKAVAAWQEAAEQAQRSAAVLEAEAHYRRALVALGTLPDGPARAQIELPLQIALIALLMVVRGPQDTAAKEAVARAGALAEHLGDATSAVLVLMSPWAATLARTEHRTGLTIARQMERLAERNGTAFPRTIAHTSMGISLFHLGDLEAARPHFAQALTLYSHDDFNWFPMSPQVLALGYMAHDAWLSGRADRAQQYVDEAGAAAAQRNVLGEVAHVDTIILALAAMRREPTGLTDVARRLLEQCQRHDLTMYLAAAQMFGGWILAYEGSLPEGLALLHEGLRSEQAEGGAMAFRAFRMGLLAEVYAESGALTEALARLDDAFAAIGDEEIWRPDLLRLRGDLLLKSVNGAQSTVDSQIAAEAERCYREAIDRARSIGAKTFELRAATRLAQILVAQDQRDAARTQLAAIYGSFTEGFASRDLRDAQTLLHDLGLTQRDVPFSL